MKSFNFVGKKGAQGRWKCYLTKCVYKSYIQYICIKRIWPKITYSGWYPITLNQIKPNQTKIHFFYLPSHSSPYLSSSPSVSVIIFLHIHLNLCSLPCSSLFLFLHIHLHNSLHPRRPSFSYFMYSSVISFHSHLPPSSLSFTSSSIVVFICVILHLSLPHLSLFSFHPCPLFSFSLSTSTSRFLILRFLYFHAFHPRTLPCFSSHVLFHIYFPTWPPPSISTFALSTCSSVYNYYYYSSFNNVYSDDINANSICVTKKYNFNIWNLI